MTRKLESLFDFAAENPEAEPAVSAPTRTQLAEIDATIDKIDAALPTVRDLETGDRELDELASKAQETFDDLMDLGMQVDSRYASEIFAVAGTMLGHALTAKTAKLNKKLKVIDLQLKKARLDQQNPDDVPTQSGQGHVLDRNEILERLIGDRRTIGKKE